MTSADWCRCVERISCFVVRGSRSVRAGAARRGGSPSRINFSGSDKSNWRKICGPRSLITVIVSLGYHRTINYPLKMAADLQSRISSGGGRPLPIRQLFIHRCRMTMIVLMCVRELVAGTMALGCVVVRRAPASEGVLLAAVARVWSHSGFSSAPAAASSSLTPHIASVHTRPGPARAKLQYYFMQRLW